MRRFSIVLLLVMCFCANCDKNMTEPEQPRPTGMAADIDGNVYWTIQIGEQTWMMENLKVTHYRNGDVITDVTSNYAGWWIGLGTGALCYYSFIASNRAIYGCLYNWYAVNDPRGLAPDGWHVASDDDYKALEMFLGMNQAGADTNGWRGKNVGSKMKEAGSAHWYWYESELLPPANHAANQASNESGFTALPGGYIANNGRFYELGYVARFWSSTENDSGRIWYRELEYLYTQVYRGCSLPEYGFSVRCVKDQR